MATTLRLAVPALFVGLVVAVSLLVWDVEVAGGRDGQDWACGPAFKAVRGDTYGGGEMPANMTALDAACADKAGRYLWAAGVAGTASVLLLVAITPRLRARRSAERAREEGPPNLPLQ